ncbi:glycosyltransferase family 4 protein [Xanthomarina sp. F2636L]|uniref:glycosyltransferase family 4 protein n=1 Tax=Xanthomarina sp. F2636L TaxID=2996018 RepID=UPI00225E1B3B|nr:glycosyltransferase family 4 protein [Xanthomarina sp. F2636L]MCX7549979.1 glycosyltransferase family 4 protein [Xanthomarina sp. F2636L]
MRLLQITASNVWRGHEQQIVYYYDEFDSKIEHQVLLCPTDTRLAEIAKEKNYTFYGLPDYSKSKKLWISTINKIVKEHNIDIILIHNSKAHTLCIMYSLLYRSKVPMVFFRTLIKKIDTNALRKWKYNYKHLKKLVCVSQAVVDVLKPAIKDHSRLSIVGSATDISEFPKKKATGLLLNEFNLPTDTILIGNISAFVPFKDHYTFVNAAKIIKSKNSKVKFVLVGKGEMEDEIKAYVKELGLENDFIFTGFRKDIPEIFPEFDVFMFTSKLEPTGGVLLEAYNCHVPIVATNYGGIPEVVENNKTGILCEKENPVAFAEAALKIIEDKNLREQLVINGEKHLLDNFTKEIIATKMLKELQEVLN